MSNAILSAGIIFVALLIVLFAGMAMVSSVPSPESGSSLYSSFESLTAITNVSYMIWVFVALIVACAGIIIAIKMM